MSFITLVNGLFPSVELGNWLDGLALDYQTHLLDLFNTDNSANLKIKILVLHPIEDSLKNWMKSKYSYIYYNQVLK